MKNEQNQHSSSSLSQYITYFTFHRVVFNFILCIILVSPLVFILSLYIKDYIISYQVSNNLDARYDLQRYPLPLRPPPPHPLPAPRPTQVPPPRLLPPPPPSSLPPPPPKLHFKILKQAPVEHIEDDKLLRRAAMLKGDNNTFASNVTPKVAFLFLIKEDLPLRLLWEKFFQGHEGLYSIYVHCRPNYNGTVPESSVFHGRRIPSKEVEWGLFSMVDAELRLLANALLDTSNERFVLLSESAIPLYNFTTIYNYLINSRKSFVEVFDIPGSAGRDRYNPHMSPTVNIQQWRKGSQWFEMNRELAMLVISDQKYYPVFSKLCQRFCYSDEHYLPTFVHIVAPEKTSGRTITWADWSKHQPHPYAFYRRTVSEQRLNSIKNGAKCEYNGELTDVCYLFARKFMPDTLDKLLHLAPRIMQFS